MKKNKLVWFALILVLSTGLFQCKGLFGGDDENEGTGDAKDILGEITPRSAEFKPLKEPRFTVINKQVEFAYFGAPYGDNTKQANQYFINPADVVQDEAGNRNLIEVEAENAIMNEILNDNMAGEKIALAGALDDDFVEEVVLLNYSETGGPGSLTLINTSKSETSGKVNVTNEAITADLSIPPLAEEGTEDSKRYHYNMHLGDVDEDGLDEILVAGVAVGAENDYAMVWVFDDAKASFTELHKIQIRGVYDTVKEEYAGVGNIAISSGNFDIDAAEEIVIAYADSTTLTANGGTGKISYDILDDAKNSFASLLSTVTTEAILLRTNYDRFNSDQWPFEVCLQVVACNMDKDAGDEIAIGAYCYFSLYDQDPSILEYDAAIEIIYLDYQSGSLSASQAYSTSFEREAYPYSSYNYEVLLKAGDFDGDRRDELLFSNRIIDDLEAESDNGVVGTFTAVQNNIDGFNARAVIIGDTNNNYREDITFLHTKPTEDMYLRTLGFQDQIVFDNETGEPSITGIIWEVINTRQTGVPSAAHENYALAAPNVDQDTIVIDGQPASLEIEERHTVYYSRNQIIAILAAPPVNSSLSSQNIDNSGTAFGKTVSGSFSMGAEISVRAGVLVGVEGSITAGSPFAQTEVASWEAELSVEVEASLATQTTIEVARTVTEETSGLEDLIIFSTIPFDRYTYVLQSHPDPRFVGNKYHIDIPQEPKVLSVTRAYYNAHNGDQMDVDEAILMHSPGNPSTYPNATQKDEILNRTSLPLSSSATSAMFTPLNAMTKIAQYGPFEVTQGSGTKSAEVVLGEESSFETGLTISVDFMAKVCAYSVCGGVSGGISVGASFGTALSKETSFSGTVGAIADPAEFAENSYSWGIFAYRQKISDDEIRTMHDFIVVNYWVE